MTDNLYALEKHSSFGNTQTNFELRNIVLQPIGGASGSKYTVEIPNPRYSIDQKGSEQILHFFVKEVPYWDYKDSELISESCKLLRDNRFIVPTTFRYFTKDGKYYHLMTNMAESDKYRIYGLSGGMTKEQKDELKRMNINENRFDNIRQSVSLLAEKADRLKICLYSNMYHLRQNKDTNDINIIFLDILPNLSEYDYSKDQELRTFNQRQSQLFINNLGMNIDSIDHI